MDRPEDSLVGVMYAETATPVQSDSVVISDASNWVFERDVGLREWRGHLPGLLGYEEWTGHSVTRRREPRQSRTLRTPFVEVPDTRT